MSTKTDTPPPVAPRQKTGWNKIDLRTSGNHDQNSEGEEKKSLIGTKRTRKPSTDNLSIGNNNELATMMEWYFDLHAKNPLLSVDIDGISLQWNIKRTWGFCRGSHSFTNEIVFYEVIKKDGKSQQIKLGICGDDVDCSKRILQNDFNSAKVFGFWVIEKIKPPINKGDKIGVEVNFRSKYLKIYKNYVPISEKSFENMNVPKLTKKNIYLKKICTVKTPTRNYYYCVFQQQVIHQFLKSSHGSPDHI